MAETETEAHAALEGATQGQTARISQEKAMELQQLVSEQVMAADTSAPVTMTELLADEQGAFAQKAQELGLDQEWDQFKSAQAEIGQMREEFLQLEEQRAADANKTADVGAALDQEAAKVRKSSGIAGLFGAGLGAAGAAYAASKKSQSNPVRAAIGALGALVGGGIAAVFSARRGIQKVQEQVGNLENLQPDAELEQKAAELQQRLGLAQQQSMEGLVDAMVERMTGREIATQQQQAQPEQEIAPPVPEQREAAAGQAQPAQEAEAHRAEAAQLEAALRQAAQEQRALEAPSQDAPVPTEKPQERAAEEGSLESQLGAILAEKEAGSRQAQPPAGSKAEAVLRERAQQQQAGGHQR